MVDQLQDKKQLNIKEIMEILPHRYPFLLIDKIIDLDVENGVIIGQKNLTINESFFQGHFPGAPIMPGVLILEALAQNGAVLVALSGHRDKTAVLLNAKELKFRRPAKPGDILKLKGERLHISSNGGKIKATAYVNDELAVECEVRFALVDKNQI